MRADNFRTNIDAYSMASNGVLTEEDVPGAKFIHPSIEEHTNLQLKRWLKCRGLTTSGKRKDLIERCENAVKACAEIDPKIDEGKWYEIKKEPTKPSNQVPYIPISGWHSFPSKALPKHFNYGNIYHYLVESVTCFDSIELCSDTDSGTETGQSSHDVHTKNSGTIKEGTCTRSASGLGRCAHVAALLFALEDFVSEFGYDLPTCTEKLCSWNKGRKKNKTPSTVHSKEYSSMKKELKKKRASGTDIITSDPRPSNQRFTKISKDEKNSFVSDLRHIGEDSGWTTLLDYEYDNFSLDDYGVDILKQQCKQFQENLKTACEEKSHPFMADGTLDQSESEMWMFHRQCRITASYCKDVVCLKKGHTGLVKRILWTSSPLTPAILYGRENESKAFEQYMNENPNFNVEKTGLWLNPANPQLGCSPDGLIKDTQSGLEGLIEIKCPYVLKHCDPNDVNNCKNALTKKELNNFFCTIENDILEKHIFKVGVISQRVLST
uniref:SAP domain-containing protein n=1 Tax=Magallana gigas TaxID=29159 RepID=A0A8W8MG68_MAGGI